MNALNKLRPKIKNKLSLELLDELLKLMSKRFHQVEYHQVFSRATFLYPRFKKNGFNDAAMVNKVKECLTSDITKLVESEESSESLPRDTTPSKTGNDQDEIEEDKDSIWAEFDSKLSTVNNKTTPLSAAIIEIRQYAEEPNIGRKDNPLTWWKSREMIYPRLAKLAKKNLSVVATSVPSERVFSKTGQIISERRNRLKPSNVQKLIFLNANQGMFK